MNEETFAHYVDYFFFGKFTFSWYNLRIYREVYFLIACKYFI